MAFVFLHHMWVGATMCSARVRLICVILQYTTQLSIPLFVLLFLRLMCLSVQHRQYGSHVVKLTVHVSYFTGGLNRNTLPHTSRFFTPVRSSILPFELYFQALSLFREEFTYSRIQYDLILYQYYHTLLVSLKNGGVKGIEPLYQATQANETCYMSDARYYKLSPANNMTRES